MIPASTDTDQRLLVLSQHMIGKQASERPPTNMGNMDA